jgi:hypothetical protein
VTYDDYLASLDDLTTAVDNARQIRADAGRKKGDELRTLTDYHQRETARIRSRIETASSHYRDASKTVDVPATANLGIRLPSNIRPTTSTGGSSIASERAQEQAGNALSAAVADYKRAAAAQTDAAAAAAAALAARRAALNAAPPAPPAWHRWALIGGCATLALIILIVLLAVLL